MSLLANVALWLDSRQSAHVSEAAVYNDQAWLALTKYQTEAEVLNARFDFKIRPLVLRVFDKDHKAWDNSEEIAVVHWAEDAATSVSKLRKKLAIYDAALKEKPAALEPSLEAIQRLLPKTNMVGSALHVRAEELDHFLELLNEGLGALPHPGPRLWVYESQRRVERGREAVETVHDLAPRPHRKWTEI